MRADFLFAANWRQTPMVDPYIKRILSARVYDVASETPLQDAKNLSERLGNTVLLKREDQQSVFSFKSRGAFNRIYKLLQKEKVEGVIAASAGNHAQGVALAARELGLKSIIVMPKPTPRIKVDAVRALGGKPVLHGDVYDDAYHHALELVEKHGYPLIHPFDHPDTIAGQGTIGVELCMQHPGSLHAVFIPVGGGGLAAGIATYLKYLRPEVKIIGVEPADANAMHESIRRGRRSSIKHVGIFADGVAVKQPGKETYRLCKKYLDDIVLCSVDEMCAAIKDVFTDTRTLLEPAGALSVAGLKKYVEQTGCASEQLIAITSGANVNFDRMRHIAERAELGEQREALLCVTLPERPGAFRKFCQSLGRKGITEFNYRYAEDNIAHVFAGVQLENGNEERQQILQSLRKEGYDVIDLTDDEMAKLHIRYMVGGHAPKVENEELYRFEFPDRPGALSTFLNKMARDWNISLFHYRNHGSAYGRVLVGIQVPKSDRGKFQNFLGDVGYPYWPESDNPAYRAFLR